MAAAVAETLGGELDVMIVRKLGTPMNPELAMGAIASGGAQVLNDQVAPQIDQDARQRVVEQERAELQRRERQYRGDRDELQIEGRCVILVDDGLATGATMRAAVEAVRQQQPAQIIVAVPVAPPDTVQMLQQRVDQVICPRTPSPFGGIGRWYRSFEQVSDEQVIEALQRRAQHTS